jgi:Uma2 family endonuclease
MSTIAIQPPETREQRVTMRNVSWETYEGLLAANADSTWPRMTYDRGNLEIMGPSASHERLKEILSAVVDLVAEEWGIEFRRLGSTTFRRRDLKRGAEPDCCFYVERVESIHGIKEIDLVVHPAPDLVIEIEITNPVVGKLPIWADFGVPEIWLAAEESVKIVRLAEGEYRPQEKSETLSPLTATLLSDFLRRGNEMKTLPWRRMVREWARSAPGRF